MKHLTYRIEDPNGMHARPAGLLATCAKRFDSEIRVRANEKEADAKRLLSLMSLGATHGTLLKITVSGADEQAAADALSEFFKQQMPPSGGESSHA